MRKRLNRITNWRELARRANWSAAQLAQECGVSLRTLERFFGSRMRKTPQTWLMEERMANACEMLTEGFSVKETASELGYDSPQCFARQFKKHHGHCPCMHAALGQGEASDRFQAGAKIQ